MKPRGPWSAEEVERYLDGSRAPIRLACNGASGSPVVASLWFAPMDGRLWCATQKGARIVALLAGDGRCAFEVAGDTGPYRGIRGQGVATLHPERGQEILRLLVDRYLEDASSGFARWLLARGDTETAIAIQPRRLLSWDYTARMSEA